MTEKNKKKELDKQMRAGTTEMNLGNRIFKSPKDYDRKKSKNEIRKEVDAYV